MTKPTFDMDAAIATLKAGKGQEQPRHFTVEMPWLEVSATHMAMQPPYFDKAFIKPQTVGCPM